MKKFDYEIKDEIGIHARPAGMLVKIAKSYQSVVMINANGKNADATKLMAVMGLGIKKGQIVKVEIEGEDEEEAYKAVKEFFEKNL